MPSQINSRGLQFSRPSTTEEAIWQAVKVLKDVYDEREELELGDLEEDIRDALYATGIEICIAEDVGMDECRCTECIDGFMAHADYLRDSLQEEG